MSTHAVLEIKDGKKVIAKAYKQLDGHPCYFGRDIKKALDGGRASTNGYLKSKMPQAFMGMGCLAAYLVGKLKGRDIGDFYLIPVKEEQEDILYYYTLTADKKGKLHIEVESAADGILYEGPLADAEMGKMG